MLKLKAIEVPIEEFVSEYINHEVLYKTKGEKLQLKGLVAYQRLAWKLGISPYYARAFERQIKVLFYSKMQELVRVGVTELSQMPESPRWLRTMEKRINSLPSLTQSGGTACASADEVVSELCAQAQRRAALCARDVYAAASRKLRIEASVSELHAAWVTAQRVSLSYLALSSRAGDEPGQALSLSHAHVADLVLLHTDVRAHRLLTAESDCIYAEAEALAVLWRLVLRHRLEERAPPRSRVRAQRWTRAYQDYLASNRLASLVVLQRRWYELKLRARSRLLALRRAAADAPAPEPLEPGAEPEPDTMPFDTHPPTELDLAIIQRFPHIITSPLPSWRSLVHRGAIVTELLSDGESDLESDESEPPDPRKGTAQASKPNFNFQPADSNQTTTQLSNPHFKDEIVSSTIKSEEKPNNEGNVTKNPYVIYSSCGSKRESADDTLFKENRNIEDVLKTIDPSNVQTEVVIESDYENEPYHKVIKTQDSSNSEVTSDRSDDGKNVQVKEEPAVSMASRIVFADDDDDDLSYATCMDIDDDIGEAFDAQLLMETSIQLTRVHDTPAWRQHSVDGRYINVNLYKTDEVIVKKETEDMDCDVSRCNMRILFEEDSDTDIEYYHINTDDEDVVPVKIPRLSRNNKRPSITKSCESFTSNDPDDDQLLEEIQIKPKTQQKSDKLQKKENKSTEQEKTTFKDIVTPEAQEVIPFEDLHTLLADLSRMKVEMPFQAVAQEFCVSAPEHKASCDAQQLSGPPPPHTNTEGTCTPCCGPLCDVQLRQRVNAELKALQNDINAILQRSVTSKKKKHIPFSKRERQLFKRKLLENGLTNKKVKRNVSLDTNKSGSAKSNSAPNDAGPTNSGKEVIPEPVPATAFSDGYDEWIRQKNINNQFFDLQGVRRKEKSKAAKDKNQDNSNQGIAIADAALVTPSLGHAEVVVKPDQQTKMSPQKIIVTINIGDTGIVVSPTNKSVEKNIDSKVSKKDEIFYVSDEDSSEVELVIADDSEQNSIPVPMSIPAVNENVVDVNPINVYPIPCVPPSPSKTVFNEKPAAIKRQSSEPHVAKNKLMVSLKLPEVLTENTQPDLPTTVPIICPGKPSVSRRRTQSAGSQKSGVCGKKSDLLATDGQRTSAKSSNTIPTASLPVPSKIETPATTPANSNSLGGTNPLNLIAEASSNTVGGTSLLKPSEATTTTTKSKTIPPNKSIKILSYITLKHNTNATAISGNRATKGKKTKGESTEVSSKRVKPVVDVDKTALNKIIKPKAFKSLMQSSTTAITTNTTTENKPINEYDEWIRQKNVNKQFFAPPGVVLDDDKDTDKNSKEGDSGRVKDKNSKEKDKKKRRRQNKDKRERTVRVKEKNKRIMNTAVTDASLEVCSVNKPTSKDICLPESEIQQVPVLQESDIYNTSIHNDITVEYIEDITYEHENIPLQSTERNYDTKQTEESLEEVEISRDTSVHDDVAPVPSKAAKYEQRKVISFCTNIQPVQNETILYNEKERKVFKKSEINHLQVTNDVSAPAMAERTEGNVPRHGRESSEIEDKLTVYSEMPIDNPQPSSITAYLSEDTEPYLKQCNSFSKPTVFKNEINNSKTLLTPITNNNYLTLDLISNNSETNQPLNKLTVTNPVQNNQIVLKDYSEDEESSSPESLHIDIPNDRYDSKLGPPDDPYSSFLPILLDECAPSENHIPTLIVGEYPKARSSEPQPTVLPQFSTTAQSSVFMQIPKDVKGIKNKHKILLQTSEHYRKESNFSNMLSPDIIEKTHINVQIVGEYPSRKKLNFNAAINQDDRTISNDLNNNSGDTALEQRETEPPAELMTIPHIEVWGSYPAIGHKDKPNDDINIPQETTTKEKESGLPENIPFSSECTFPLQDTDVMYSPLTEKVVPLPSQTACSLKNTDSSAELLLPNDRDGILTENLTTPPEKLASKETQTGSSKDVDISANKDTEEIDTVTAPTEIPSWKDNSDAKDVDTLATVITPKDTNTDSIDNYAISPKEYNSSKENSDAFSDSESSTHGEKVITWFKNLDISNIKLVQRRIADGIRKSSMFVVPSSSRGKNHIINVPEAEVQPENIETQLEHVFEELHPLDPVRLIIPPTNLEALKADKANTEPIKDLNISPVSEKIRKRYRTVSEKDKPNLYSPKSRQNSETSVKLHEVPVIPDAIVNEALERKSRQKSQSKQTKIVSTATHKCKEQKRHSFLSLPPQVVVDKRTKPNVVKEKLRKDWYKNFSSKIEAKPKYKSMPKLVYPLLSKLITPPFATKEEKTSVVSTERTPQRKRLISEPSWVVANKAKDRRSIDFLRKQVSEESPKSVSQDFERAIHSESMASSEPYLLNPAKRKRKESQSSASNKSTHSENVSDFEDTLHTSKERKRKKSQSTSSNKAEDIDSPKNVNPPTVNTDKLEQHDISSKLKHSSTKTSRKPSVKHDDKVHDNTLMENNNSIPTLSNAEQNSDTPEKAIVQTELEQHVETTRVEFQATTSDATKTSYLMSTRPSPKDLPIRKRPYYRELQNEIQFVPDVHESTEPKPVHLEIPTVQQPELPTSQTENLSLVPYKDGLASRLWAQFPSPSTSTTVTYPLAMSPATIPLPEKSPPAKSRPAISPPTNFPPANAPPEIPIPPSLQNILKIVRIKSISIPSVQFLDVQKSAASEMLRAQPKLKPLALICESLRRRNSLSFTRVPNSSKNTVAPITEEMPEVIEVTDTDMEDSTAEEANVVAEQLPSPIPCPLPPDDNNKPETVSLAPSLVENVNEDESSANNNNNPECVDLEARKEKETIGSSSGVESRNVDAASEPLAGPGDVLSSEEIRNALRRLPSDEGSTEWYREIKTLVESKDIPKVRIRARLLSKAIDYMTSHYDQYERNFTENCFHVDVVVRKVLQTPATDTEPEEPPPELNEVVEQPVDVPRINIDSIPLPEVEAQVVEVPLNDIPLPIEQPPVELVLLSCIGPQDSETLASNIPKVTITCVADILPTGHESSPPPGIEVLCSVESCQ